MKKNKSILLALDGFSINFFRNIRENGGFNFLNELFSIGKIYNTQINLCARGWPMIFTGENVGQYRGYYYLVNKKNYNFFEKFSLTDYFKYSLFNSLSQQGYRLVVIGVPTTYPPQKINGVFISAGAAGGFPENIKEIVRPEKIAATYSEDLSKYICDVRAHLFNNSISYLKALIEATKNKTKLAIKLIHDYAPDISIVGFAGCDRIGHAFWPYLEIIKENNQLKDQTLSNLIKDYFEILDDSIKTLVNLFDFEKIIIVSDHGMIARRATLYINKLLIESGFAYSDNSLLKLTKETLRKIVINRFSPKARVFIKKIIHESSSVSNTVAMNAPALNWKKTRAFGSYMHGVYINKADKYYSGIVSEKEYENYRENIIDFLRSYRHPIFGKIFEFVGRREEFFSGRYLEDAPDIVFDLQDGIEIRGETMAQEIIEPFEQVFYSSDDSAFIHNGIHSNRPFLYLNFNPTIEKGNGLSLLDISNIMNA